MSRLRTLMRPLAVVLALPLGVAVLGLGARSRLDARWTESLARQLTVQRVRPDARTLARYSLASLCGDGRPAQRIPPCRTYNTHSALVQFAAAVAAAGLAFVCALMLAGVVCRGHRQRLLRLFRPTALFTAFGVTALAGANGLLAAAGVTAGWAFITGRPIERVSMSIIVVAGMAAVAWVIAVSSVAFSIVRRPTLTILGRRIAMSAHPRLEGEVRRVAAAVGADPPPNVVACLVPWIAVTEMRMTTLDGSVSGRTLCLSLPLCRILSVAELRALVEHELFPFRREEQDHTRVGVHLQGMSQAMGRIAARSSGIRRLAAEPPLVLFGFLLNVVHDRGASAIDREVPADQAAASAAGADVLASALAKVQLFAPTWNTVTSLMVSAIRSGTQYVNASALFQEVAASNAPAVSPDSPALGLLADAEAIELELSSAEHRLLARTS